MNRRVALTLLVLFAGSTSAEETKGVVFANVTVLDGIGGPREKAWIGVRDGKVVNGAIDGRRIEVAGAFVTPGLVDAASRAGYSRADAEHTREMTPDVDARDLADPWSDAFRDAARAGCTTVSLVPGPSNVVSGLSRTFSTRTPGGTAKPLDGAPQALWLTMASEASGGNFTPRGGPTESIYARRPNTRMGVVWMLRQTLLDAKARPDDVTLAPYRDALGGKRACRVVAHRWQDMTAMARICDEVGLADVVFAGAEEAYVGREELAKRKTAVIVGPFPPERRGGGPDDSDTALSNAAMLRAAGVRVALTAGELGGSRLREQAMAAVRWGLPKADALAAVTSVAAELCGLPDRGRIKDGAPADLVLWSGDPLLPTSRALVVVIGGEVVFDETTEARK
jgi:imidazolonepropionase-like amidohydrolase